MSPVVSVIIPVYNGEADIPDLLECLRSQTYPRSQVEYLLVDNNSRDRTAALIQAATQIGDLPLQYLLENRIQSSYAARNAGIQVAKGNPIAFTDADCRPEPQWLADLIAPFDDPDVGIVAGEIAALPGDTIWERYAERGKTLSQKYTLENTFLPYGQTANLAIRKEILAKVGLFRPYLTTGGDADICWRIQQQIPCKLHFAQTAIVRHRHRASLAELQSQWRRYGRSNRYLDELHQVGLMQELTQANAIARLVKWFLKELPLKSLKALQGKATLVDILNTPIATICLRSRSLGQRDAKLPEEAREIEWLRQ